LNQQLNNSKSSINNLPSKQVTKKSLIKSKTVQDDLSVINESKKNETKSSFHNLKLGLDEEHTDKSGNIKTNTIIDKKGT